VRGEKDQNMTKSLRTVAVLVVAIVSMLMVGVGAAVAQEAYPPPLQPDVVCVPSGQAGAAVICTVTGFQPGEQLDVSVTAPDGTVVYSATLTADAEGQTTFRFTVPPQYRGMELTVRVAGAESGEVATDTVAVAAPGRTGEQMPRTLARTGQDMVLLAAVGAAMIGAGIAAVRRRGAKGRSDTHAGV
jgi:LPXTG-motif cell wall-anchored protein